MNSSGILHNFDNQRLYTPAFDLIQAGLSYKQQKFDTNKANLQNLYDQFQILKVDKTVDQDYIEGRLQQVRDISNKYSTLDLSNDSFANSLMSNIGQVLDDKVKNAVYSTKVMENEQAQWSKAKTEGKGTYNEMNHAYALNHSDMERYLSSENAGDLYQGGAGFIEYTDISKLMMDNLPKLGEYLKAEWVQEGPQQGYFRSLDKMEAISRDKMEAAIGMMFDGKVQQQMKINSWATYKDHPEALLKQEYENYFSPQLEEANKKIEALDVLISDPQHKGQSQQYQEMKDSWIQKRNNIQNYSYDNVVKNYGKESAAQSLYNAKYKENLLDVYSYEPRLIERSIDQVQKANVEFDQKLREYDNANAQWDKKYAIDLAQELRAQDKALKDLEKTDAEIAKIKGDTKGATVIGAGGSLASDFIPVSTGTESYARGSESHVAYFDKLQNESISEFKKAIYASTPGLNLTNKELQDVSRQLNPGNIDPNERVKITVRGKDYTVDMKKHYDTVLNMYNNVVSDSPEKKQYFDGIKSGIDNTISDYGKLAVFGNGSLYGNLPKSNVQIIKNKQGEFEMVKTKNTDHYYELLRKKGLHDANPNKYPALTDVDQKNLELFTGFGLVMDAELDDRYKQGQYRYVADKALLGVKTNGLLPSYSTLTAKSAGESRQVGELIDVSLQNQLRQQGVLQASNTTRGNFAQNPEMVASSISQINALDKIKNSRQLTPQEVTKRAQLIQKIQNSGKGYTANQDWLPGDMGYYDTNYTLPGQSQTDMGSMETRLNRRFQAVHDIAEQKFEKNYLEHGSTVMRTDPGSAAHAELTSFIASTAEGAGLLKGNKHTITIKRLEDPNMVEWSYVTKESIPSKQGGGSTGQVHSGQIEAKLLKARGIYFDPIVRSPYRAELGTDAPVIPLGVSSYDQNTRTLFKSKNKAQLPLDNIREVIQQLQTNGSVEKAQEVNSIMNAYKNGEYTFNIEVVEEGGGEPAYMKTIRRSTTEGSEIVFYGDNFGENIRFEDVKKVSADKIWNNEAAFAEYLNTVINNR